jgi:chaperonin cofactor prefoldin
MQAISNTLGSLLTRTKESPAQTVFLVSAVLAGGVGLAYSGLLPSFSRKQDGNLLPAVTEEEAKKAMKSMLDQLHLTIPKLFRVADQIKQQFAQQGQQIDDSFLLRSFLLPNLETAFREIQDSVLNELDMDEDDLEEAVLEYIKRGDRDLKETFDTIRNIFKKFGADIPEDDEEEDEEEVEQSFPTAAATDKKKKTSKKASKKEMSLEDTIRFFKAFRQIQHDKMEATIEEFIIEYGRPSPSNSPVLLQRLMMEGQRFVSVFCRFLFFL